MSSKEVKSVDVRSSLITEDLTLKSVLSYSPMDQGLDREQGPSCPTSCVLCKHISYPTSLIK